VHGSQPRGGETQRRLLLAANLVLRGAIIWWLAEAWVFRDDPRFAGKAIPERNAAIVGSLSLLIPATWVLRRRRWRDYPAGLDLMYLSIFALDMAGNSLNFYNRYRYFDLLPHLHGTGAFSVLVATWWAARHPGAARRGAGLAEATLLAAGVATMVHVALEAQEYYTDVLAGTVNVGGVADTVNDLGVGLIGALVYPPLLIRWFLPRASTD